MIDRSPLLLVGGLAHDRFDDGAAAGGSVLHAARALALDGRGVAILTMAGSEPPVAAVLAELASLGPVTVQRCEATIGFRISERGGERTLTYLGGAERLDPSGLPKPAGGAVLLAPIAGELDGAVVRATARHPFRAALLQGWLRRLEPGRRVEPLGMDVLAQDLRRSLATLDLLVASREDLAALGDEPEGQIVALRADLGARPLLVVTDGPRGIVLDSADAGRRRLASPRVVDGVSAIGAGDAFAAAMTSAMARGIDADAAAADAAWLAAETLAERSGRIVHIVGDVHGMHAELLALLHGARLIDRAGSWTGGRDELWASGDLLDRGPDGAAVVTTLRRLEGEAAQAGGRVGSVFGNHELLALAARRLPHGPLTDVWLANGGRWDDLRRLDDAHLDWLATRPAMVRLGTVLLQHADTDSYRRLGTSVHAVNARVVETTSSQDGAAWAEVLSHLSERRAFVADPSAADGQLATFGGRLLVHGHTPVQALGAAAPEHADGPHRYAGGRCVAVDTGLWQGGPARLFQLPPG